SDDAVAVLTPEFLSLVPGFFATDVEQSVRNQESLLRLCCNDLTTEDLYLMLGYNLYVPAYVRQGLLSRSVNNDDLLPRVRKPVLIVHGGKDTVVRPTAAEKHRASIAHAQVHMMAEAGHAPFFDDAPAFNRVLAAFVRGATGSMAGA